MGKYLKNGMSLVYLDQCAASELGSPHRERWNEIDEVLAEGVRWRRVMCPRSVEHICETSRMTASRAQALDRRLRDLSFERAFLPEAELATHQMVAKVRNTATRIDDFLTKHVLSGIEVGSVQHDARFLKSRLDTTLDEIQKPVNEIRAITRRGMRGDDELKQGTIDLVKDRYCQRLSARLDALSCGIAPEPEFITVGENTFPHWATFLCILAVKNHGFTPREAKQMLRHLDHEGIDAVPAVCIRAELEALFCIRQIKEEPADQWDIMRVASALPYADVMVVDGGRTADIVDLELDRRFKTRVFSTRPADQDRLLTCLREMVYGSLDRRTAMGQPNRIV